MLVGDEVEAALAIGFKGLRVGNAGVAERGIERGILPVACGDGIAGSNPVRSRATATERGIGSGTLTAVGDDGMP